MPGANLVKVEDQVQLTHIAEVVVENLYKEMNTLQVGKLIISDIYTHGEKQASISPVYHFVCLELHAHWNVSEAEQCSFGLPGLRSVNKQFHTIKQLNTIKPSYLYKVCELWVPRGYQSMNLVLQAVLFRIIEGDVVLGQSGLACSVL